MALCTNCSRFDFRSLITEYLEEAQRCKDLWKSKPIGPYATRRGARVSRHLCDSIDLLVTGASAGCELCLLLIPTGVLHNNLGFPALFRKNASAQELAKAFPGPVLLGAEIWEEGKGYMRESEVDVMLHGAWRAEDIIGSPTNRIPAESCQMAMDRLAQGKVGVPIWEEQRRQWRVVVVSGNEPIEKPELMKCLTREIYADGLLPGSCPSLPSGWLKTCLEEHDSCINKDAPLPTRVIDVGASDKNPSLYITRGEISSWVALSYCWGTDVDFTLTRETYDLLIRGCELEKFPATIRDAIIITRSLGIRYLWVDALCIFQDSLSDWEAEAPKMGDIYHHAKLTIAAKASDNVHCGILNRRNNVPSCRVKWKQDFSASGSTSPETFVQLRPPNCYGTANILRHSRWATRAWTVQEELLSTRLLSFTSSQMIWQCPSVRAYEAEFFPRAPDDEREDDHLLKDLQSLKLHEEKAIDLSHDAMHTRFTSAFDLWYYVLIRYAPRSLTNPDDRLPALAGLASSFYTWTNDEYIAGMWKKDLVHSMLWRYDDAVAINTSRYTDIPSWSWASLQGTALRWRASHTGTPFWMYKNLVEDQARILDVDVDYVSPSVYSAVYRASVTLEAPCYEFCLTDNQGTKSTPSHFEAFIRKLLGLNSADAKLLDYAYFFSIGEFDLRHQHHEGQTFVAVQMMRCKEWEPEAAIPLQSFAYEFLLLESKGVPSSYPPRDTFISRYRRIGVLSMNSENYWKWFTPHVNPEGGWDFGKLVTAALGEIQHSDWTLRTVIID